MKAPVFLVALALVLLQSVIAKPHGGSYKTACDIVRNGTLLLIKEQQAIIAIRSVTLPWNISRYPLKLSFGSTSMVAR